MALSFFQMDITEKLPGHLSPRTSALFSMLPVCLFSSRRSEKNKYLSLGFHFQRRLCSRYCVSFEHQLLDLKFLIVSVLPSSSPRRQRGQLLRQGTGAGPGTGEHLLDDGTSHQHGGHIAHVGTWEAASSHEHPLKENSCLCHSQQPQPQLK